MSADARGVLRGQCQACGCDAYDGGDRGFKCLDCGHAPRMHVNLSAGPPTQNPPRPQISPPTASLPSRVQSSAYTVPSPPAAFATGGPRCQFSGCTRETHFDMNSLKEYPFCTDHINVSSLPSHMDSVHLDSMDYGETVSSPALPTHPSVVTPVQSLSSLRHTPPPTAPPTLSLPASQSTPSITTKYPFLVSFGSPRKKVRSKAPSPVPLKRSLQPLQAPALQPLQARAPPPLQPQSQPSVPPDQQCKLVGCTMPKFVEPGGRVHDFCGRTHANQYAMQQSPTLANAPADLQCKTPGCLRPRRMMDDGSGYYDFCSLTCRDQGASGSLALSEGVTCSFPGCTRPKYVDPANNRTHDFCGRTHAFLAQKQGIVALDNVGIRVTAAGSQEFTVVSGKFQQAWAKGKGSCPPVSFIFVINNRQLQQRWSAHQQKLSVQTMEEHYHGTVLLCDITTSNTMCNDKDCGICGISRTGFDRRYIRKNINFQRFGHGFYVAPNSSKCHDYTQGAHGYRAMLLCDVCPGRKYVKTQNDENLQGPPPGYDSVHGQAGHALNYDEVVIYNPDCVLPRYVIVYQLNGTHKIAK